MKADTDYVKVASAPRENATSAHWVNGGFTILSTGKKAVKECFNHMNYGTCAMLSSKLQLCISLYHNAFSNSNISVEHHYLSHETCVVKMSLLFSHLKIYLKIILGHKSTRNVHLIICLYI